MFLTEFKKSGHQQRLRDADGQNTSWLQLEVPNSSMIYAQRSSHLAGWLFRFIDSES
jgi:hypothetical protein